MHRDCKCILFTEEDIRRRVAELGEEITRDYSSGQLFAIGILKGSVLFFADLVRAIQVPVLMDFMGVSSYQNRSETSGEVRILKDLDFSVEGRDVLIVEDIVDSGYTLRYLCDTLERRGAKSVKVVTFLDKASARRAEVEIAYRGFEVPNAFIVGYGLDYAEQYRNLPYIGILREELYQHA